MLQGDAVVDEAVVVRVCLGKCFEGFCFRTAGHFSHFAIVLKECMFLQLREKSS